MESLYIDIGGLNFREVDFDPFLESKKLVKKKLSLKTDRILPETMIGTISIELHFLKLNHIEEKVDQILTLLFAKMTNLIHSRFNSRTEKGINALIKNINNFIYLKSLYLMSDKVLNDELLENTMLLNLKCLRYSG